MITIENGYYHKMWLNPIISVGYASPMFNTYSISKYFFLLFTFHQRTFKIITDRILLK